MEIIKKLVQHIQSAQDSGILYKEIFLNTRRKVFKHEFLFFIKPEITIKDENIKLHPILEMMFDKLGRFGLNVHEISILGADYLDRFNIIAQHYGVINAMSRRPHDFLTSEAKEKFRNIYHLDPDKVNLLGSLEFLEHYPQFNAVSLEELWMGSETFKLAGGTYCAQVNVQSHPVYLVNGFHPRQLIHFTEKGRSIVTFRLAGDLDWSAARNEFIGKTNPADALPGSLRNDLLANQKKYGLFTVSSGRNGFHLSAGPVEGLVELIRYCSEYSTGRLKNAGDFIFGKLLKQSFTDKEIGMICDNQAVMYNGKKISVFDVTEERNNDDALKLLQACKF
jgi:hypothetical protein